MCVFNAFLFDYKLPEISVENEVSVTEFWERHLLRHQGEGVSTHGRTWHQLDHHMLRHSLEMHPCHLL